MAFSTQKVFFHLPFRDETIVFKCDKACVKMKTYPSSHDYRAWAASDSKKSRFVTDLVACNMPSTIQNGEDPDNDKNNSSAKKPRGPDNRSGGKRPGSQSKNPDQRRRGQDDHGNKGKQDQNDDYGRRPQDRHIRPDSGNRGGLSKKRSSFGGIPQKLQSPTFRRYSGPNPLGQGSTLRKRVFSNSDEESFVHGGRCKMGTSQSPYCYRSSCQGRGRYNQPEYPTQDQGGNDRYGNENPYMDQVPTSSKYMGQVYQGTDSYNHPTAQSMAPDTDARGNYWAQLPEPIREQRKYVDQANQEQGEGKATRGEYERYQNYDCDYCAPRGYVDNSPIREEGWDNFERTHDEPSYRRNDSYRPPIEPAQRPYDVDDMGLRQCRHNYGSNQEYQWSGNWRAQDTGPQCCHQRSNQRSSGRHHTVPPHIQLQRQQAYERLCAYAAGNRRNIYGPI